MIFFFDQNDVFTQMEHRQRAKGITGKVRHIIPKEIATERKESRSNLRRILPTIEKYAREKYLMKRDNEDIFIISEKPDMNEELSRSGTIRQTYAPFI